MNKIDELIEKLCPNGVEYKKLDDLLDYEQPIKYIVTSTKYSNKNNIPVLTAGQSFILGYTNETVGVYKSSKENPVIIFDDFTTSFHWVDFDFKVKSSAIKMLKPKNYNINFRYIYYVMSTIKFIPRTHVRHWISIYSQFEVPVPPLEIQREIVYILDKFTALLALLKAELKARKKQYSYYLQKLIDIDNEDLEKISIGELFEFKNGINKSKEFFGTGTPIINYIDVYKNNKLYAHTIKGKVESSQSDLERYDCKRGDVFFTRTSETKEEVGIASVLLEDIKDSVFSGFLLRARPITNKLLPEYCAYCLISPQIRNQIVRASNITTRATTTGTILSKIKIPIPAIEVQEKVANILDKFNKLTNSLTEGIPAEIEARQKQYEYYRDKLLTFKKLVIDE